MSAPAGRTIVAASRRPRTRFDLVAWLRVVPGAIGAAGMAGIALLVATAAAWPLLVVAPCQEAAAARRDIARLRARQFDPVVKTDLPSPSRQIDRFRATFPDARTLPDTLTALSAAARAAGVELTRGEFKLAEEPGLALLRYEGRYPVKGPWRGIFALLSTILNENPHIALEEVTVRRESRAVREVEAQLRLTMYFSVEPRDGVPDGAANPPAAASPDAPAPPARALPLDGPAGGRI